MHSRRTPNSDATLYNYGILLKALNRPDEALQRFSQALVINPVVADSWNNRGATYNQLRCYQEAIIDFDKAIAINPNHAAAYCNKAASLAELKIYDQALAAFERALALEPKLAAAWSGGGGVLLMQRQFEAALATYDKAIAMQPDLAEGWLGRGNTLIAFGRNSDAEVAYDRALALKPNLAEAWLGRGNAYHTKRWHGEAMNAYDKALALKPYLAEAWLGRGNSFYNLKNYDQAIVAYERGLALAPDLRFAVSSRLHVKQRLCDWTNFEAEVAALLATSRTQNCLSIPFFNLSLPMSTAEQYECAVRFVAEQPPFPPHWRGERYAHERIRVAYISSDLREHPVAHLMAEVFEQHDKSRFEMTAISLGPERESEIRSRIKAAFEHFVDAEGPSDDQIADYVRQNEIDIVVDLNGLTDGGRLGVLARRPAPIQVNYLGYAGTLGADYYDYIIGDRTIVPKDQFEFYCEKVVWLPGSYMPTELQRPISDRASTRTEQNLPENGFVFCCFNASYKLAPEVFAVWMRLLKAIEGSVLWLSSLNDAAKANLRRETEQAGVSPDRLIFATRVEIHADHLARHSLADLFLDTLPYNAHATAVDALWAGLPVLTCLGDAFPGRVAASLLNAVGLPELITGSLADYEALALKLAREPGALASLKAKLACQRETFPLFDSQRFTRNIEAAYVTMWERYRNAQPPVHFAVDGGA